MIFSPKPAEKTCDSAADAALHQADAALQNLVIAAGQVKEALKSIDGQIEALTVRRIRLHERHESMQGTINGITKALHIDGKVYAHE